MPFALTACDAGEGLWGEYRSAGFSGTHNGLPLLLSRHDNPLVLGTHVPHDDHWDFTTTPQLGQPSTSEQRVWAVNPGSILKIEASQPIFGGDVTGPTTFLNALGATVRLYETKFASTTAPWFAYPQDCETLWDSACQQFQSRPAPNQGVPFSFPYFIGDISLVTNTVHPGDRVRIKAVLRNVQGNVTGTEAEAYVASHPDVRHVPVHVHIFVDQRGNMPHSFMGGLVNSGAGREDMFRRLRAVFDDYAVDVKGMVRHQNVSTGYATSLTRDTQAEHQGSHSFDSLAESCNVQVQLKSVQFVQQSFGLETAEIGFANSRSTTPFWPASDDQQMAEDAQRMTDFILSVPPDSGIHIWVAGDVNPGSFSGFDTAGIAFRASRGKAYALIAGESSAVSSRAGATQLLNHELGHVLGLEHGSPDGISALLSRTLSSAMCTRMRSEASAL